MPQLLQTFAKEKMEKKKKRKNRKPCFSVDQKVELVIQLFPHEHKSICEMILDRNKDIDSPTTALF